MRTITVLLGGVEYTISELPSRQAAKWRDSLQERLGDVATLIEEAPETDISSGTAVANLVRSIGAVVLRSPDTIKELLFEYAPDLQKMEQDEADYYDSELAAAFVEVVKLAYPFGQLVSLVARFGSGAATK